MGTLIFLGTVAVFCAFLVFGTRVRPFQHHSTDEEETADERTRRMDSYLRKVADESGASSLSTDELQSSLKVSDKSVEVVGEFGRALEILNAEGYGLLFPVSRLPYPEPTIRDALNEVLNCVSAGNLRNSAEVGLRCLNFFVPDEEIPADLNSDEGFRNALKVLQRHAKNKPG